MIYYRKIGKGKPIILLHGLTGNNMYWKPIEKYFSGYKLIMPDLPGHGKSKSFKHLTWKILLDELKKIIKKEKIKKPVLIGHSLGGMLSLYYAAKNRGDVAGLIVLNSSAYIEKKIEPREFLRILLKVNIEDFEDIFEFIENFTKMDPKVIFEGLALPLDLNIKDELRELKIPSLFIIGKNDKVIHAKVSKETARLLNAKVVVIGAGHNSLKRNPKKVGEEIGRFLKCISWA